LQKSTVFVFIKVVVVLLIYSSISASFSQEVNLLLFEELVCKEKKYLKTLDKKKRTFNITHKLYHKNEEEKKVKDEDDEYYEY